MHKSALWRDPGTLLLHTTTSRILGDCLLESM